MLDKCIFYAVRIFLTCCFIGMLNPCPGTLGSFVGIVLSYFVYNSIGSYTFYTLLLLCVFLAVGVLSDSFYSKTIKITDPKEVILDEIIGQIFSINLLYYFAYWAECYISIHNIPLFVIKGYLLNSFDTKLPYVVNFIFFRIFDIAKPYPINYIDKKFKGGIGIMLDDIVAGFFAAIFSLIFLIAYFSSCTLL